MNYLAKAICLYNNGALGDMKTRLCDMRTALFDMMFVLGDMMTVL